GIFLGALSIDVHLHDTYFVVAHFHYVMMGGTILAFVGGLHHWWPQMFGRMYNEKKGQWGALLIVVGFNVAFVNQFVLGHQGMPRRYYTYLPQYQQQHVLSTVGAYILLFGFLWIAYYLLESLFKGEKASANPWGGVSLEWHTASPP